MTKPMLPAQQKVEKLKVELIGSLDGLELQLLGFAYHLGQNEQFVEGLITLYKSTMEQIGESIVERWRWISNNTVAMRWLLLKRWRGFANKQMVGVMENCGSRFERMLRRNKALSEADIVQAKNKLGGVWTKTVAATWLSLDEVETEKQYALTIWVIKIFKWPIVTIASALIGAYIQSRITKCH